jgi:hypothetical protein
LPHFKILFKIKKQRTPRERKQRGVKDCKKLDESWRGMYTKKEKESAGRKGGGGWRRRVKAGFF